MDCGYYGSHPESSEGLSSGWDWGIRMMGAQRLGEMLVGGVEVEGLSEVGWRFYISMLIRFPHHASSMQKTDF